MTNDSSFFMLSLVEISLILIFVLLLVATAFIKDQPRLLERNLRLLATIDEQRGELLLLVEHRDDLEAWNRSLRSDLAALEEQTLRMRKPGLDASPCWSAEGANEIEYLYTIVIREDDLEVRPAWPQHRDSEVKTIDGASELIASSLQLYEFKKRASIIYYWSLRNNCRHYVSVVDETSSKSSFKEKLLAIETYFYKYLVKEN